LPTPLQLTSNSLEEKMDIQPINDMQLIDEVQLVDEVIPKSF